MADVTDNPLGPDLHVDEGQTHNYDTSIGGHDIVAETVEEQEVIAEQQVAENKCEEPKDNFIGKVVTYLIKSSDQHLIGDRFQPGLPVVMRVIAKNTDGTLDLESVSPLSLNGHVFKVLGVHEGGNAGHFQVYK